MTSQVNPNNIDGAYPVAGQDNDSQGFRDNFTNIRNNFTFVKAELEDLQNKAILKSALTNSTLDNDLDGSSIVNPALTSWSETYLNVGSVTSTVEINFADGNFQRITLGSAVTLSFTSTSWPSSGKAARLVLWVSVPNSAYTLTLPGSVTLGDVDTIAGISGSVISFNGAEIGNSQDYFFEFTTVNGGTTLSIRDLTRNRVHMHSGLKVTGGNIVANATTVSTSATTGALVVIGGAGVAGNTFIGGNVYHAGGTIGTNFAVITLTDNQNFFANATVTKLIFDTASSATIANARIALPSGAENGREITMSFAAPITACWVNQGNTALVKWFPNASVSSGNVSVTFTYSSAATTWYRT